MSGDFRLESDGTIVATATKPSVFRREFAVTFGGRTLTAAAALGVGPGAGAARRRARGRRRQRRARCGPAARPRRCPTRCRCRSASSSLWLAVLHLEARRRRRGRGRVVDASLVALHYVERPAPAPLAAAIECVWSVVRSRGADRAAARSADSRRLPRADRPPRRSLRPRRRRPARAPAGGVPRRHAVAAVDRAGAAARRDDRRALPPGRAHRALRRVARRHRGSRGAARRAARAADRAGSPRSAAPAAPASARPGRARRGWLAHVDGAPRAAASPAPACAGAVRAIHRRRGRIGVEALAAAVGLPRRRLERLFRRETALTPEAVHPHRAPDRAPAAARRAGSGSPDRRRARRRLLRPGAHGARLQGAHRAARDGAPRRRRRARRALHASRSAARAC